METPENQVMGLEKGLPRKNKVGLWVNIIFLTFIVLQLFATLTNKSWDMMKVGDENLPSLKIFLLFTCLLFLIGIIHFVILIKKDQKAKLKKGDT